MRQPEPALCCYIAVDWGTSHLRAYCCQLSRNGEVTVLGSLTGPGVKKVQTDFKSTLLTLIAPWLAQYGQLPVYLAGQIGSSIGWLETAYLACPIRPEQILQHPQSLVCDHYQISIMPGLSCRLPGQQFDAMRGEELQILGLCQMYPEYEQGEHLLCLPGTHTKWVLLRDGVIEYFKTALTGELFDLLCHQSVLLPKLAPTEPFCWRSFATGAAHSLHQQQPDLLHSLFSVRSRQLFAGESATEGRAYLSGLLIGSDIKAAMQAVEWQFPAEVVLIGNPLLRQCFSQALTSMAIDTMSIDVTAATLAGFARVALAQQLMPD